MIIKRKVQLLSIQLCFLLLIGCQTSKNISSTTTVGTVSNEIIAEKKSLFKKLEENNHLSIQERILLYHELKKNHYSEYNFEKDRELNQYGYSLLQGDKTKEAIEIFKLLVSEFPDSFNPYDSLGEAYLKDGNEKLSLLNYEKSVELNPKNHGAIDQINKLKGLELLVTDWGKEIFHFPIHFAPKIPYEGIEEVVFPKNWINPDSADFWSYIFVWGIENSKEVTASELEDYLKIYFDGLMDGLKPDKNPEVIIKTSAHFKKNEDNSDEVDFVGNLTIHDAFATHKPLDLNARIFSSYCEENQKLILLFRFSPQAFNHPVWDLLRTVKVRRTVCER